MSFYRFLLSKSVRQCLCVVFVSLFMGSLCLPVAAFINGPWLWMIASGNKIDEDQLAAATDGKVTETFVAEHGVNEGDTVGDLQWTRGIITPSVKCGFFICRSNNINEVVNEIGLSNDPSIDFYAAYALINIVSPREQKNVKMGVGSDDAVKVWLNGEVVHVNDVNRGATDIQDRFFVDFNKGENLLLVKVTDDLENWALFFEIFLSTTDFTVQLPIRTGEATPPPDDSLAMQLYEKYSDTLQQAGIEEKLPTVLTHLEKPETRTLLTPEIINLVVENPAILGLLGIDVAVIEFLREHASIRRMFSDPDFQELLKDSEAFAEFATLVTEGAPAEMPALPADVDGNGVVDVQDLIFVATHLGEHGDPAADVNGDGVVDVQDVIFVAAAMNADAAAPSVYTRLASGHLPLRSAHIQLWLTQAQRLDFRDTRLRRGVRVLEQLLRMLTPQETNLLANYPNPFNPETWIPYRLAVPGDVSLTIYGINGQVVRRLALGHQPAGFYTARDRAAYWDGRNSAGEPVASGVYFYTLTADNFTATRKMLIRK